MLDLLFCVVLYLSWVTVQYKMTLIQSVLCLIKHFLHQFIIKIVQALESCDLKKLITNVGSGVGAAPAAGGKLAIFSIVTQLLLHWTYLSRQKIVFEYVDLFQGSTVDRHLFFAEPAVFLIADPDFAALCLSQCGSRSSFKTFVKISNYLMKSLPLLKKSSMLKSHPANKNFFL